MVSVEENLLRKRDKPASPNVSPKKPKQSLPELLDDRRGLFLPPKKLKMPEFTTKFSAKSLDLVETPEGTLVPKTVVDQDNKEGKKKWGRPLGSRNKNPPKNKKTADTLEPLRLTYPTVSLCPTFKGKEKS